MKNVRGWSAPRLALCAVWSFMVTAAVSVSASEPRDAIVRSGDRKRRPPPPPPPPSATRASRFDPVDAPLPPEDPPAVLETADEPAIASDEQTVWDLVDEVTEVAPAPDLTGWTVEPLIEGPGVDSKYPFWVAAQQHDVNIWDRMAKKAYRRGVLRRGRYVPGRVRGKGSGCYGGNVWMELAGGGFVCTGKLVHVHKGAPPPHDERLPDRFDVMPYRYARVMRQNAPRFDRLPTAAEAQRLAKGKPPPKSLAWQPMQGDVFLAIGNRKQVGDVALVRTVSGQYVLQSDLKFLSTPPMHGEAMSESSLPLAFVFGEDAPLFVQDEKDRPSRIGIAPKHARLRVTDVFEHKGNSYVLSEDGLIVPRTSVRMVEAIARPRAVSRGARWLHIDLSEQFLVAYEGDSPVFATLISSGKPGHNTPVGEYKIRRKYISKTMAGGEDIKEPYEVEEVPWAQYFYAGYAIHAAYWHNDFGRVRSHGCVNISPADARWLYDWTSPDVPGGWQAAWDVGTHVYVTW